MCPKTTCSGGPHTHIPCCLFFFCLPLSLYVICTPYNTQRALRWTRKLLGPSSTDHGPAALRALRGFKATLPKPQGRATALLQSFQGLRDGEGGPSFDSQHLAVDRLFSRLCSSLHWVFGARPISQSDWSGLMVFLFSPLRQPQGRM